MHVYSILCKFKSEYLGTVEIVQDVERYEENKIDINLQTENVMYYNVILKSIEFLDHEFTLDTKMWE